jgi:hypothetical protein
MAATVGEVTIQAAARGWATRAENRLCRQEFEELMAEVEGDKCVHQVCWGRLLSVPRIRPPEPDRIMPSPETPAAGACTEPSVESLHSELRQLKMELALRRGRPLAGSSPHRSRSHNGSSPSV